MNYIIFNRGNGQQFVSGGINDVQRMLSESGFGHSHNEMVLAAVSKMEVGEHTYVGPNWVIIRSKGKSVDIRDLLSRK